MFKLVLITIVGVAVLVLLFEVRRGGEPDLTEQLYLEAMKQLVESQSPGRTMTWRYGAQPLPGTVGRERDYVVLEPEVIEWSKQPDFERRQLRTAPEPPATKPMPSYAATRGEPTVVAKGFVQTDWVQVIECGLGEHKIRKVRIGDATATGAQVEPITAPGCEPELRYYESFVLPFEVCRVQKVDTVEGSFRHPLGKELVGTGEPWVVWGEPVKVTGTTCEATLVLKSLEVVGKIPTEPVVLRVREQ
jgi:hypothetical protein